MKVDKIEAIIRYPNTELLMQVFLNAGMDPIPLGERYPDTFLIVGFPAQAVALEEYLNNETDTVHYVGCWNLDGSHYIWEGEENTHRNYSLAKYTDILKDIIILDDDNEPIGEPRRPNEEEVLSSKVTSIQGAGNRDLTDIDQQKGDTTNPSSPPPPPPKQ